MKIRELDQNYVDTQLACPPGKTKIEFVDPQGTGLYIEVRATGLGHGTYYLRFKDGNGKTCHVKLGRTNEMKLEEARASAIARKASLASPGAGTALIASPKPGSQRVSMPTQVAAGIITLDTFVTEHYRPYAEQNKRSYLRDDQLYKRLKPRFGHLPLTGITKFGVKQMQTAMLDEGLAKATVNLHIQMLRRYCNLAVQWDMMDRNPLTGVQMLHLDNQRETYLSDEQVTTLVKVLQTHENRTVALIVMFLLSTGARVMEGLSAQWKDVDLASKMWRIPATNSKSRKVMSKPLNENALWVLEQLGSRGRSPYLFPSPTTGKSYTFIRYAWQTIKRRAGIPTDVRLHDLRHTFASRLVSAGCSLYEVQMLLGHADPRMTQRYAHLSPQRALTASNAGTFAIA